ncbi:cell wall-binding repeat-containing protein [Agromyces subbeticus]|uniref:cell wall-binding repeat-containing protein n=1 Tax=Agromyces subbeticus TaxID=293890 RepID=UPI00247FDCDE|nr:cell wall-binding repeat-containing protein [Agromyces subbeticus]
MHRLAGVDRFATSVAISQRFAPNVPVVYVATGADFPDALSAAAPAAHLGGPLLLTHGGGLPTAVRNEVVRLAPGRIVVVGGEAVIGAGVYEELAMLAPAISRVGGADRYESGELLIADSFTTAAEAFVATGSNFPDALAASAAAGSLGAPVFLVDGESVRPSTITALSELGVRTVRIAGGSGAVSAQIAQQLTWAGFTVLRHEGADRYLTAAAINAAVFGASAPVKAAFIANGDGFADALAGAALAGVVGGPLYVARNWCVPQPVSTAIGALAPTARVLLGGPAVLSDSVGRDAVCAAWMKPAMGRITDVFGPRAPICTPGGCTQSFHRGLDLGTGCNAPIYAAAAGRVVNAGWLGTYGNWVRIDHGTSTHTGYAHIVNGGILVSVGQSVLAGQQIAWSGATGAATGCHLHFEVYENGTQVDPVPFMLDRGIRFG